MTVRKYISASQETTLTVALTNVATTMTVISAAGLLGSVTPAVGETFTVVIDPDTSQEEIVDVIFPSSPSSSTLTITRNVEPGSTALAHSVGAKVRHMAVGRDFREANAHIENTTTAHGLTIANVLETTDTNMITNAMLQSNSVTTAKITDLNVTTAKIADSAITSAKIADLTIATGDIADSAITSAKIADLTIATGDIADSAITSAKIADGTIVAGDIADGAVTSAKILNDTIVNADINTSAQIAYSKLNLTNTIVNADINASAAIALSKLATDPLARANHTGTQTASTVSDFDTQVRTSRLDQMAAPTGSVSANSQKITNLATPTSNTDAATKAYADLMIPLTQKGAANGVAELDGDGLLPANRLPSLSITTTQVVATQAAMLALTAQTGDVAVRTDLNKTFILTASPATTLANWQELLTPTDAVLSVDGQTGTVSLSSTYATVANAANKLPLAGGTMSGPIAMSTNKITGVGDPTNAQDVATKNYIDSTVLAPSNLTGVITSVGNLTSIASQTGTGSKFVVDNSPTLITPVLGVATATSINGTTIPTSKTLVATDSTVYVVPSQSGNSGKYLTTDGTTSSWAGAVSTDGGSTITVASGTTVPLTIQNNGTGNSFQVNDVASDTTPFVINSDGAIGIGTATPTAMLDLIGPTGIVAAPSYLNQTAFAIRNNFHTRMALVNGGTGTYNSEISSFSPSATHPSHNISMTLNGAFIFSGGLGTASPTERLRIDASGLVGINGAASGAQLSIINSTAANVALAIVGAASQSANLFTISDVTSGGAFAVNPQAAQLTMVGYDSTPGIFLPRILLQRARGTAASPSAVQTADVLFSLDARGYGATAMGGPGVSMRFFAAENYTDTAKGTFIQFNTTAIGSTTISERFRIDDVGNVGISMAVPSSYGRLAIGLVNAGSTTTNAIAMYQSAAADASVSRIAGYAYTGGARTAIDFIQNSATNFQTQMAFSTDAGGGITERMRINAAGLVGIGAAPSGAMFQVFNTVSTNVGATVRGASGQTADLLQLQNSAGTDLVRVTAAGKVGIQYAATAQLHVATGSTTDYGLIVKGTYVGLAAGSTNNLAYISDGRGNPADGFRFYQYRDTTAGSVGDWGTSSFRIARDVDGVASQAEINFGAQLLGFSTGGSEHMRINAFGNIGIGTTSPSVKLAVDGTISVLDGASSITVPSNSVGGGGVIFRGDGNAASRFWQIVSNSSVYGLLDFQVSSSNSASGFSSKMVLTGAGGMGIGTTSVTEATGYGALTINGSTGVLFSLKVNGTETFRIQPTGSSTTINGITNLSMLFNTNNTERMRISGDGSIGIGTGSPSNPLEVSGTGGDFYPFRISNANTGVTTNKSVAMIFSGADTVGSKKAAVVLKAIPEDANYVSAGFYIYTRSGDVNPLAISITGTGVTTINSIGDATTTTAARGAGYMGIPQSAASGSGSYTIVAADAGEHIYTTTTRTVTIPANGSVAFPIGTVLSFISGPGATTTIAITTDTMYLAGPGTTGTRTLAAHGMATAVKVAATTWYISGNGLT